MRFARLCLFAAVLGCASQYLPDAWPRLGNDQVLYVWDEAWGALPDGMELGNTHGGMAVDAHGLIYASRDTAPAMLVFDQKGKLRETWGEDLGGGLHGMCLNTEHGKQFLYLAHTGRHEVLKTTLDGEVLWRVGLPPAPGIYASAEEYHPTAIAVAKDGRFFVADGYGKGYIHRYSADREYLGSFGGPGAGDGQFHTPHGLAVDERNGRSRLLVADRENNRVQLFDLEGNFQQVSPVPFRRPCGIALGPDGRVAVPELAGRVTLLDEKDHLLARLGDNPDESQWAQNGLPREQWRPGIFISPHGAAFDAKGNLYIQDWLAAGRFTRLVKQKGSLPAATATAAAAEAQSWQAAATGTQDPLATWLETTDADGKQVVTLTSPNHQSHGTFNLYWSPNTHFQDGSLEVSLRANRGEVDQGGGLIWRAQDPDNYYVARANPLEDNLRLYTVKDGHRHELASADLPLAADTWYRLRIDHHGDHIQVSLDGKAYLDFHDHTFPQAGAIGYWTKADAATSFTDLQVMPN